MYLSIFGFIMPALSPGDYISIDAFYDVNSLKSLPNNDFKSIPILSVVILKLLNIMEFLHENNIFVIDLKPQNIRVSKSDLSVHILDCDGFLIKLENGEVHPASLVSTDYISPEAMRTKLRPQEMGEAQDRYALSVLIFQLLNRGIHPFQGIVTDENAEFNTNDEKAEAGLYPYSFIPDERVKPNPRSVDSQFPLELNFLFEKAFTEVGLLRPSAKEWKAFLEGHIAGKKFKRCENVRSDPKHIHFGGGGCVECFLTKLTTETVFETYKKAPSRPPPPAPPYVSPNKPKVSGQNEGIPIWVWVLGVVVLIIILNMS